MLPLGTVDVVGESLQVSPEQRDFFASLLSRDELTRAERFYFPTHRDRFIVARGMLRVILGHYLQLQPHRIEFVYSSRGKPSLPVTYDLIFNLSHSQDLVMYGFSRCLNLGVDVEHIRPVQDLLDLSDRFFAPQEAAFLRSLPPAAQTAMFFQIWTAKEAYLKALGEGIGGGLEKVELLLSLGESPKFRDLPWSLIYLDLAPDYTAALALAASNYNLRVLTFATFCP
jgi:4'-phosphopantetheinyl transferase